MRVKIHVDRISFEFQNFRGLNVVVLYIDVYNDILYKMYAELIMELK